MTSERKKEVAFATAVLVYIVGIWFCPWLLLPIFVALLIPTPAEFSSLVYVMLPFFTLYVMILLIVDSEERKEWQKHVSFKYKQFLNNFKN